MHASMIDFFIWRTESIFAETEFLRRTAQGGIVGVAVVSKDSS